MRKTLILLLALCLACAPMLNACAENSIRSYDMSGGKAQVNLGASATIQTECDNVLRILQAMEDPVSAFDAPAQESMSGWFSGPVRVISILGITASGVDASTGYVAVELVLDVKPEVGEAAALMFEIHPDLENYSQETVQAAVTSDGTVSAMLPGDLMRQLSGALYAAVFVCAGK